MCSFNFYKLFIERRGYRGTIGSLIFCVKPPKVTINELFEKVIIEDDTYNKLKNGSITRKYYLDENDETEIAMIRYKIFVGQVGLFFIDKNYRNNGLGKEILEITINDMCKKNVQNVWAVTSENHPFWSNVFSKSFKYMETPHPSVTGSGHCMSIQDYLNYKHKNGF